MIPCIVEILRDESMSSGSVVQCSAVQCSAVQCSSVQCCGQICTGQCTAVHSSTVQYFTVPYCTASYYTALYSAVFYSTLIQAAVQYSLVQGLERLAWPPDSCQCNSWPAWVQLLQCSTFHYNAIVKWCTVQGRAVKCSVVQYSAVQRSAENCLTHKVRHSLRYSSQ